MPPTKRRVYIYYTGEIVFTQDGITWFMTKDDDTVPIPRPNMARVAVDITNI